MYHLFSDNGDILLLLIRKNKTNVFLLTSQLIPLTVFMCAQDIFKLIGKEQTTKINIMKWSISSFSASSNLSNGYQ